jgi:hypothetical protein
LGKADAHAEYSVLLSDPLELAQRLKEALHDEPPVFTQWFAGWLRHPHTTPVVVTAYVKKFPDDALIREKLPGRRVSSGRGGLRLVLPKDEGVLHPSQTVRGLNWCRTCRFISTCCEADYGSENRPSETVARLRGRVGMSKFRNI